MSVYAACEAPHTHQGLRAVIWFNESEPHPQKGLSHFPAHLALPFLVPLAPLWRPGPFLTLSYGWVFIPSPPKPHPPAGGRPASPGTAMLWG